VNGETMISYDQSSYDLAERFLEDEPELNTEENRNELAQLIQNTIEDFIVYKKDGLWKLPDEV